MDFDLSHVASLDEMFGEFSNHKKAQTVTIPLHVFERLLHLVETGQKFVPAPEVPTRSGGKGGQIRTGGNIGNRYGAGRKRKSESPATKANGGNHG